MGKLNIAHHKSYHPYRRDNIERVRKDEEEARQKEAVEEGRMMLADSEARMDLLRQRAGLAGPGSKGKRVKERDGEDLERAVAERDAAAAAAATETPAIAGPSSLTTTNGHINLFEDLERQTMVHMPVRSTKNLKGPAGAVAAGESEKGVPLAPSAKDLNPWYSDKDRERTFKETDDDRRIRDLARKSVHDPLTSINTQLASRDRSSVSLPSFSSRSRGRGSAPSRPSRAPPSQPEPRAPPPPSTERQTRESAERQRALELIRRKKRELAGSETPSTVRGGSGGGGGDRGYGYGDVFNRREVEEVHQQRSRRRDWDWDHRDRERDRERERDRFGSRR